MKKVGVVGSGTMGIEIAQAAAEHGYDVVLYDLTEEIVNKAIHGLINKIQKRVNKGKYSEIKLREMTSRIAGTSDWAPFHDCMIVIEAVPESLKLKQEIFEKLEEVCGPEAVLATNTSSLSITAISGKMKTAHRVIGCHFFNPASVMKLVEIIPGVRTDAVTTERTVTFVKSLQKEPALVQDTPGFIVNRVARSFYSEALRIVDEGTSTLATVDNLARKEAGFPMGPFELMDFIGIDVNFAVTQSVYEATFHDARFRPHIIQQRKVEAGLLGRKTGAGFYNYDEHGNAVNEREPVLSTELATGMNHSRSFVVGDGPFALQWLQRLQNSGETMRAVQWETALESWQENTLKARTSDLMDNEELKNADIVWFITDSDRSISREMLQSIEKVLNQHVILMVSNASVSVTEQASWCRHPERLLGFNAVYTTNVNGSVELAKPLQSEARYGKHVDSWFHSRGIPYEWVGDNVGFVMPRIVSMIVNEAAVALTERIATAEAIDSAMKLGTRYPFGPLQWANHIGIARIYRILEGLHNEFGDDRYRPAPILKKMMLANKQFYM